MVDARSARRGRAAVRHARAAPAWSHPVIAHRDVRGLFARRRCRRDLVAIQHRSTRTDWWVPLVLGLCSVAAGVVAMLAPGITALVLIAVMGANAIVTGVFDLIAAVRLRKRGRNAWMLFLIGILSAVFGIVVLPYPGAGALALVWMIGTYALIIGALLFVLGITARGWLRGGFSDKPSTRLHS
jgi:uncharacterized membrane protein HdeD (DUF308 family)